MDNNSVFLRVRFKARPVGNVHADTMNYTIQETSKKVNMSTHTLRYYERVGVLPPIQRDQNGNRLFSDADIEWINMIYCLRNTEMPISLIKYYIELSRKGDETIAERRQIMLDHKQYITKRAAELHKLLTQVTKKVEYYDSMTARNSGRLPE